MPFWSLRSATLLLKCRVKGTDLSHETGVLSLKFLSKSAVIPKEDWRLFSANWNRKPALSEVEGDLRFGISAHAMNFRDTTLGVDLRMQVGENAPVAGL
jgi:hypothetical protein